MRLIAIIMATIISFMQVVAYVLQITIAMLRLINLKMI